jgi:hypothetical protein
MKPKILLALFLALSTLPAAAQNLQQTLENAHIAAKSGRIDDAFAALKQLTDNGYGRPEVLNADNALLSLRMDARWATTIAAARKNAHPCVGVAEYRQFDYWLGEWNVEAGGQRIATSSISAVLDDCVISEDYHDFRGYYGKSFSIWDSITKRWEQRYVDTTGAFHEWKGGLQNGTMQFLWRHNDAAGVPQLDRMTYSKDGPDKVRQLLENSTDDGKTWAITYDGMYIRRK